jgi:hypothetical protein
MIFTDAPKSSHFRAPSGSLFCYGYPLQLACGLESGRLWCNHNDRLDTWQHAFKPASHTITVTAHLDHTFYFGSTFFDKVYRIMPLFSSTVFKVAR